MTAINSPPPNDEQAERALLGYTLHLGRIPESVDGLGPSDFYRPLNETVWSAMRSLTESGKPCDLVAVRAHLQERGELNTRNGVADMYLIELIEAPSVVDAAHTAEIISRLSQRRQLIQLLQSAANRAHDPTVDIETQVQHAEEALARISSQRVDHHIQQLLPRIDWHELWADDSGEEWIVYPLIPARRGIAVYSPAKIGKSLLMLEIAVAISLGKKVLAHTPARRYRVLYVDSENDPRGDVRTRLQDMGYGPDDFDHLDYLTFPALTDLDTEQGAGRLMAAIKAYAQRWS